VLREVGAGEVVGELAVLTEQTRCATPRAIEGTRLLVMRGDDFLALMHRHADMAQHVVRVLSRRLATAGGGGA
jgi:CRP-like cAMP-binding protein